MRIQRTSPNKYVIVLRILVGAPLLIMGAMHLAGAAPLRPILEVVRIPAAGVFAILVPVIQVVAGLSILSGFFIRLGAILSLLTMKGALATHLMIKGDEWPTLEDGEIVQGQEPIALMYAAMAMWAMSIFMVWKGGGAWSVDRAMVEENEKRKAENDK